MNWANRDQKSTETVLLEQMTMWEEWGQTDSLLWGVYRGSGTYQVKVDLQRTGYHCNCPSRKLPCKHVQALMFLPNEAHQANLFASTSNPSDPPEWAKQWYVKRRESASQQTQTESTNGDGQSGLRKGATKRLSSSAKKRSDERHQRVLAGLARLEEWLRDTVRQGLVHLEPQAIKVCEAESRRLVDAQAGGLVRMIQAIADDVHSGPGWHQRAIERMGRLLLICRAYRLHGDQDSDIGEDLRQLVGWTVRPEYWRAAPTVNDVWSVLGQTVETQDRLRAERSWLAGRTTGRVALLLQFAFGNQSFPFEVKPGSDLMAQIQYYPGRAQQRVKIHSFEDGTGSIQARPIGYSDWNEFLAQRALDLGRFPWLEHSAGCIQQVRLAPQSTPWRVVDRHQQSLPIAGGANWNLLAICGPEPIDLAIEFDGQLAKPLGIWDGHRYLVI